MYFARVVVNRVPHTGSVNSISVFLIVLEAPAVWFLVLVAESVRLSFSGHSRRVTLWNTTQQCKETEQRQTTWTNLQGNTAE